MCNKQDVDKETQNYVLTTLFGQMEHLRQSDSISPARWWPYKGKAGAAQGAGYHLSIIISITNSPDRACI